MGHTNAKDGILPTHQRYSGSDDSSDLKSKNDQSHFGDVSSDENTPLMHDIIQTEHTSKPPKKYFPRSFTPTLIGSEDRPAPDKHARFGLPAFLSDISDIHSATVPVSLFIAVIIGVLCGISAFLYYTLLEFLLDLLWHTIPETLTTTFPNWPASLYWIWIPIMGMICAVLVGLAIIVLGFPGDLAYTVKCVHKLGYVPLSHAPSMVAASQLSILGGGSLGPEAPLVAICASVAGWVSLSIFKCRHKNVVRKHTLCGMACALAAFFGVPLGGSLFALEINNRLGYEYFEHAIEAIASGTICLVVFRSLARLPIGPIYFFTSTLLPYSSSADVLIGGLIGLVGALIASLFAHFHWFVIRCLRRLGWDTNPLKLSIFGGIGICTLGVLIPQTMFWGENEMNTIGSLSPASTLIHVWPTTGATGFEITGTFTALLVGLAKLLAVSFTVSGGYRGGFIFPFFAAGAAFGRAIWFIFPSIPPVVAILSMAAGINVAITRTVLATPLILCALAGEQNAVSAVLAASLVSAFATYYMVSTINLTSLTFCLRPMTLLWSQPRLTLKWFLFFFSFFFCLPNFQPFIFTQQGREDIFEAQIHSYSFNWRWRDESETMLVSSDSKDGEEAE